MKISPQLVSGLAVCVALGSGSIVRGAAGTGQPQPVSSAHGFDLQPMYSNIGESEYEIRWHSTVGTYQSPNRAQNMRFTYWANGFTVERRAPVEPTDNWKVTIELESYGKQNPISRLARAQAQTSANKAKMITDEVVYDYSNETNGLHQTFLIKQKPVAGNLILNLAVASEGLQWAVDPSGDYVYFFNPAGGDEVMRYSDLVAYDALGRKLPAQMQSNGPNQFALVVDDTNAQYPVLVDPWIDRMPDTQTDPGAHFGFSVAYFELLQTDGIYYGSIAIGAPWFDDDYTDQGKVFLYYTDASGMDSTPDWAAEGDGPYVEFGYSIALSNPFLDSPLLSQLSPTLNNDALSDLVVGQPEDSVFFHQGKVSIWYGQIGGFGTSGRVADRVLNAPLSNVGYQNFGWSLAIGDVNNDLLQDLVVGAPATNPTQYGYGDGAIHLYKATVSGIGASPDMTIFPPTAGTGESFGESVAYAGKVNIDDFHDIVVGAPTATGGTFAGKVYLYAGNSTGLSSTPLWTFPGTQSNAQLGYSVCGNVTVDGDGKKDIIVGAPFYDYDATHTDAGRVYVFRNWNGTTFPAPDILEHTAHRAGARLGFSVSAGDFNLDGFAETIVGAPYFSVNPNDHKGVVLIFWGTSGAPLPTQDQIDSGYGTVTSEHYGSSVAFIPKTTPGSLSCFIGGAPEANVTGSPNQGATVTYAYRP